MKNPQFITRKELAWELGISQKTLERREKEWGLDKEKDGILKKPIRYRRHRIAHVLNKSRDFVSREEIARLMKVSLKTVERREKQWGLQNFRDFSCQKPIRYYRENVIEFVKKTCPDKG